MIKQSYRIFQYMEPRLPISSQALKSLHELRCQVTLEIEYRALDDAEESVMPSVERNTSGSLEGVADIDFDWLTNPSALLSRQSPGLDMSWLAGSDAWLS